MQYRFLKVALQVLGSIPALYISSASVCLAGPRHVLSYKPAELQKMRDIDDAQLPRYLSSRVNASSSLSGDSAKQDAGFAPLTFGTFGKSKGFGKSVLSLNSQNIIGDYGTNDNEIVLSLNPRLQKYADDLLRQIKSPHVAIVAMEPSTGRVLALAERSSTIKPLVLHNAFPAASLFKIVTSAAAVERRGLRPSSLVRFRGSDYTLERWNYKPDPKRDNRVMSLAEALGKSCNAVFGRVALQYLSAGVLREHAYDFGFNQVLRGDFSIPVSKAVVPEGDYELSRTAAGFGNVFISPIHAAALMSGIANKGVMPKPLLIDEVRRPSGPARFLGKPQALMRMVEPGTARTLAGMMEYTTTVGTSKRDFFVSGKPTLPGIRVAAKTGTLRGKNPRGVNNWFIAAAPLDQPEVAVAVIVINPGNTKSRASSIGRAVIGKYLGRT